MQEFKEVLAAVSPNLEELHIHENAIRDDDFTLALLSVIAEMPRLKMLNMARNGQLSKASIVGVIQRMTENWVESEAQYPLPFEKLVVSGTMLLDEGITELLPLLAGPAFGNFKNLNVTATKLTQESLSAFTEFLSEQFPIGRRLVIEMRMLNIRKSERGSKENPLKTFQ